MQYWLDTVVAPATDVTGSWAIGQILFDLSRPWPTLFCWSALQKL